MKAPTKTPSMELKLLKACKQSNGKDCRLQIAKAGIAAQQTADVATGLSVCRSGHTVT